MNGPTPMVTIAIRVPPDVKARLARMTKWNRNQFCREALAEKFARDRESRQQKKRSKS